jgi:hypothetical protein
MHHCNIDRLWAMWQADGNAGTYPSSGGDPYHHRTDLMYPWTGGAAGFGTNISMPPIVMPDVSALGPQSNEGTLDHRALGYTYDTLAILGISLDRTGSMTQLTPDPMTVSAPDVTKWEAATRGVSALLQDCEAAYSSKEAYVWAGVETFRSLGGGNQFTPVLGPAASGIVKAGGSHGQGAFDAAIAGLSPGGGTPLADALVHADAELVKAPFADLPAGETRYLAILTDGMRTSGSTIASVGAGSLGDTVVFAMGFGTGADVDFAALDELVTKGTVVSASQVFHGENAGTIDKFYSNSLAEAMGYTPIVDPVLELFAGEHTHVDFYATSAEDSFFLTAQGMDFDDPNWTFHLVAPDGTIAYGGRGHADREHRCRTCHCPPKVTARRANGRLSLFLQRDSAPTHCWVGKWSLMVAYKAPDMARMLMLPVGSLLAPVSAGPVRGPRYHRRSSAKTKAVAARLVPGPNRHALAIMPPATSGDPSDACNAIVNIYGRTRLRLDLDAKVDGRLGIRLRPTVTSGRVDKVRAYGRLFSPRIDLRELFAAPMASKVTRGASLRSSRGLRFDCGKVLAKLERDAPERFALDDSEVTFDMAEDGVGIARAELTGVSGVYHVGILVEGVYYPGHHAEHGGHRGRDGEAPERFERVLSRSVAAH